MNQAENEESEQWIGEWMEARGNRDQMVSKSICLSREKYRSHFPS